ncbi:MAG: N-formylglutamate amidohydrolase [Nitrospinales bacterium]
MIFHIPHSSLHLPSDMRSAFLLDDQALEAELLTMTDAYTDDLFGSHAGDDDSVVTFPASRLVLDPERFLDDTMETMSRIGMGVIYERTSSKNPLRNNPTLEERDALIQQFYIPHHKRLNAAIESELSQHGSALILDCHSFPAVPLPCELDQDPNRPDICIGTDEFHTPKHLLEVAKQAVTDEGMTCQINRPFNGSIVPRRYYKQDRMVSSIMIEVNRSLYMDEGTGVRSFQYGRCRASLGRIILKIRSVGLPYPK